MLKPESLVRKFYFISIPGRYSCNKIRINYPALHDVDRMAIKVILKPVWINQAARIQADI